MTRALLAPAFALLLLAAPAIAAAQGTVFVVRHAERADTSADSLLSAVGEARAARLGVLLKDAGITQIYTTTLRRTVQTAAPLAAALQLTPTALPVSDLDALFSKLNSATLQDRMLVVGHSNTLPQILQRLGVVAPVAIGDTEYDNLFIVIPQMARLRSLCNYGIEVCRPSPIDHLRYDPAHMTAQIAPSARLTPVQWLICAIAAIGFAFDIYEILMLPLIVRPALLELTGAAPGSPQFQMWVGRLFYIPAFAGGIFGLLGGYLTDRLGRRRVLTYSILIYAVSAFLSGFSTSIEMLLLFRCLVFIGVCVEFVAAVAWLAELFPDPIRREKVLGYTQAFSSLGGIMVATVNGLVIAYAAHLPSLDMFGASLPDPHAPWRYTLMSGVLPAIPLILIRPFLPESPSWQLKKAAGTLGRPSLAAIFSPELRRTTIVTTIMFACAYGAAFGAIQQVPQIVPGLPEVRQMTQGMPPPRAALANQEVAANVTKVQEIGGLVGRVALAYLAVVVVSRRKLIRMFQIPGLIVLPITFAIAATTSLSWLNIGIFLAGFFTVGQFSFWGNYLPRVYPLHLRGTGESFAANIGGRLIGTSFAWLTATLAVTPDRAYAPTKVALVAAAVAFSVYLIGFIASFWLPEPPKESMPD